MDHKDGKALPHNTVAFPGLFSRPLVKLGETPVISPTYLVVLTKAIYKNNYNYYNSLL